MQFLIDYYASLEPQTRVLAVLGLMMGIGVLSQVFFLAGDPELYDRPNHLYPLGYWRHRWLNDFTRWF